jgi:hypothetical protein
MGRSILLGQIITSPQSQYALMLRPDIPVEPIVGLPLHKAYMRADGGAGSYVYSIAHPPAWLSINAVTGQLIGTPPDTAEYLVEVTVQDGATTIAYAMIRIKAIGRMRAENVTPVDGEVAVAYSYTFTVSGNTGSVTWAVISGDVPDGCTLSSSGILSGIPTTDGYFYFSARATDTGNGDTLDVACVLHVYGEIIGEIVEAYLGLDPAMQILPPIIRGAPVTFHARQVDGIPGARFFLDDAPSGITCNSMTGIISGVTFDSADYGSELALPSVVLRTVSPSGGVHSAPYRRRVAESNNVLQPMKNSSSVGPAGPREINLIEGTGVSITASNDGERASYTISASVGNQSANAIYAGPTSGSAAAPTFRALVAADLPDTIERMVSAQAPAADTINNTNVATAFATNYTIAAADLKAGCVIRVRAHGSYGTTGTPTITIQLRLSNTSVLTLGPYTLPNSIANTTSWEFEGDVYVPSISASVACRANGHCFIGAGPSAAGFLVLPQSALISLATNASKQVQLFVTWGTANTSNTITLHQLHVEVLG